MITSLIDFFKGADFSLEEFNMVVSKTTFTSFKKGQLMVRKLMPCNELHIINEGLFRKCLPLENGNLKTLMIYQPGQIVTDFKAFINKKPAEFVIEALKDSIVTTLTYDDLQSLYKEIPSLNSFIRKLTEQYLTYVMDELVMFHKNPDPIKKYTRFLDINPNIEELIPQHMIADMINISAVHLSRIRNNIIKNNKCKPA